MSQEAEPRRFTSGGMSQLIREHDWTATPIAARASWPVALLALVDVMLGAKQPMFVAWGPESIIIYNDGYAEILARKHPSALGLPFLDVWPEIRDEIVPLVERVFAGDPVHMDDIALLLERNGYPEETHFSFSYTPVRDSDTDLVVGFFCACAETTKQVLGERRLRDSEAEARGVLEGMGEGFVLFDRDFRIRRINAEGLRLDGRSRDEIVGQHLLEVWPEAEHLPTWPMYRRVMADRSTEEIVYRHVSDMHDAWLEVRAFPSGDGVAVFYRDVTAPKRAEVALRESEAQFRALAQAMPNQAWTARPDGNLDWFNQQVFAYSGLGQESLAGQGWAQIVHPDDVPRAAKTWARSLVSGEAYEVEFRIRRADGAFRWHLIRAQAIRAEDGSIAQWVGTNTDVEEQRLATAALGALNSELERRVAERTAERDRVWRNSRDLLVVIATDGVFRAVNPAWTAILGHDSEEVVGRSFLEFIWADDADLTREAFETASEQDLTSFEHRYRHKDGTPLWISWHTTLEGDLIYAYGRDVTAAKEQAEALRQAEEALRQSQKMEAVGQLTGGLAHDFNNLLTGIAGSLELLQIRVAQGRVNDLDRYIAAAQGASRRAAVLTHRLLAFSRRQTLDPKPIDVNRLVAGMEELIRRTVGPAVTVEAVAAGGLWNTLVDPHQLESALLNLCINARDAMPESGGRLTIETGNRWLDDRAARERDVPPGQYVSLCVSDTGSGMTPEVAARAFEPFFTTKPIGQGTGLGLSMIYGFVRQSGGQVRIYSEPGQGAMVCLYLPRHLGDAVLVERPSESTEARRASRAETVLVVDDEATVRMLVTEVLGEFGYAVIEAADGATGLKVLQSDARIDLLVTDVGLPGGMNGRQVADAGRAMRPGLKVLFITGYAENAVVGHGHLDPGTHLLTKPFAMDELASRINDLIEGR